MASQRSCNAVGPGSADGLGAFTICLEPPAMESKMAGNTSRRGLKAEQEIDKRESRRVRSRFVDPASTGNVVVYNSAMISAEPSARIVAKGSLLLGMPLPGRLCADTLLYMEEGASLIVTGEFTVASGCQIHILKKARLTLGTGYFHEGTRLCSACDITIGDGVCIEREVAILDTDHHEIVGSLRPKADPIRIGNGVVIGMRSMIMKGVTIGDGAEIAPGSVIRSRVPPGCLVGGHPQRILRRAAKPR